MYLKAPFSVTRPLETFSPTTWPVNNSDRSRPPRATEWSSVPTPVKDPGGVGTGSVDREPDGSPRTISLRIVPGIKNRGGKVTESWWCLLPSVGVQERVSNVLVETLPVTGSPVSSGRPRTGAVDTERLEYPSPDCYKSTDVGRRNHPV